MYKEATKLKLRIATNVGQLSVEQLWDLPMTHLDELAVGLEKEYKTSANKSFLVKKTLKNKVTKLKFDIVLDILNSKVEASEAASETRANKEHNQKIYDLIEKKKDGELEGKTVKQLEKMLK